MIQREYVGCFLAVPLNFQYQNEKRDVCLLSLTAIKGWKSQHLFILRVLSPSKPYLALSITPVDNQQDRFDKTLTFSQLLPSSTRPKTGTAHPVAANPRHTSRLQKKMFASKRICWEPRSSVLPQAPPSWYLTSLHLPAGLQDDFGQGWPPLWLRAVSGWMVSQLTGRCLIWTPLT